MTSLSLRLTTAQWTAITWPCRLGIETTYPRFRHQWPSGYFLLTVNFGHE